MKIKKAQKNKVIIATVTVSTMLIGGYGAYAYFGNLWPFLSNTIEPTQTQKNNSSSNELKRSNDIPTKHTPKQYETSNDIGKTDDITGTLNTGIMEGKLQIRVTIPELLGSGQCTITLTKYNSHINVTRTAEVIDNPSTSSCAGWDILLSELSPGRWNINILITSGEKTGHITGEVDV